MFPLRESAPSLNMRGETAQRTVNNVPRKRSMESAKRLPAMQRPQKRPPGAAIPDVSLIGFFPMRLFPECGHGLSREGDKPLTQGQGKEVFT